MEKTKIEDLLKGTVANVTEAVAKLSDADLASVREAEKAGQNRSTLLAVIDGELTERAEKAKRAAGNSGAASERTYTQAEFDKALDDRDRDHAAALEGKQRELDTATSERDALLAERVRHEEADAAASRLAEASGGAGFDGYLPREGAFVRLIDASGAIVKALPEMPFGPGAFTRKGSTITLATDIDLPAELAASEILGAVLLDEADNDAGAAMAVARLVQPFAIGGGRTAKLPAGTLTFAKPANR